MFSRCTQTTVGTPAVSNRVTASTRPGRLAWSGPGPDGAGLMNAGSICTGAPMCPAYGSTEARQRAAGELTTRTGPKQPSSGTRARAWAWPWWSSGRSRSSPSQSPFCPADVCRSTMNGTVRCGQRANSSSTPRSSA
jgi:hypothetical protein